MLELEADDCLLVTDCELHQVNFFPQILGVLGAAYKWDYFLYFFTASCCIETDELKARS